MPNIDKIIVNGTSYDVDDATARVNASAAMTNADAAVALAQNAVSYTEAQTISDSGKATARSNIGAAADADVNKIADALGENIALLPGSYVSGVWKNQYVSAFIKVVPGSTYEITAQDNNNTVYYGLRSATIPPAENDTADFSTATGWTSTRNTPTGTTESGVVPDDVNYLWFYVGPSLSVKNRIPVRIVIGGVDVLGTAFDEIAQICVKTEENRRDIDNTAHDMDDLASSVAAHISQTEFEYRLQPYGVEPYQMSLFKASTNIFSDFDYHIIGGYYGQTNRKLVIKTSENWQGWLIRVKPSTTYAIGPVDYGLWFFDSMLTSVMSISTDNLSSTEPNTITTSADSCWMALTQRVTRDMSGWMMVEGEEYPAEYISGHPQWMAMPINSDDAMRHPTFIYSSARVAVTHYSDRTEVVIPNGAQILTEKGFVKVTTGATLTLTASNFLYYNATDKMWSYGSGVVGKEIYYFGFVNRNTPQAVIFGNYTEVRAKTIAFMGDSITAGVVAGTCYHEFVHDRTHYTCLNYGFGGAGYYRNSASQNSGRIGMGVPGMGVVTTPDNFFTPNNVVARLAELNSANTDGIVIFAGTNDYGNNVSLENFRTAVASAYEYAQAHFPAAPILVMTPIHRMNDGEPNTQGATLRDYCDIIIEECVKHGIAYIDMMTMSGLNPSVPENCALYYPANLTSGLHPGVEGHRRMASMIWRVLSDMVEYHNFSM